MSGEHCDGLISRPDIEGSFSIREEFRGPLVGAATVPAASGRRDDANAVPRTSLNVKEHQR